MLKHNSWLYRRTSWADIDEKWLINKFIGQGSIFSKSTYITTDVMTGGQFSNSIEKGINRYMYTGPEWEILYEK